MNRPKLSVVIPAYNEEERLTKTLPTILEFFNKQPFTSEIIVTNDGSSDGTAQLIKKYRKKHRQLILVDNKLNRGKGAALQSGFERSTGAWVLFMDADLSTPLSELDKFWPHTKSYDVIIGSRKTTGAQVIVRQSWLRENLGKLFTTLTNTLATKDISDVTCGFKLFRGEVGRELFAKSKLADWSFDAEVLFLAQTFGYKIKEVPVEWHNDPRTKVNMLKDGLRALEGLLKIRLNYLLGKYV